MHHLSCGMNCRDSVASAAHFNNSTWCIYWRLWKVCQHDKRQRGFWHHLSRRGQPLISSRSQNIPPNINILPAVWGEIWKCSIISLGFIWEHPSFESSTLRISIPTQMKKKDINVLMLIFLKTSRGVHRCWQPRRADSLLNMCTNYFNAPRVKRWRQTWLQMNSFCVWNNSAGMRGRLTRAV